MGYKQMEEIRRKQPFSESEELLVKVREKKSYCF